MWSLLHCFGNVDHDGYQPWFCLHVVHGYIIWWFISLMTSYERYVSVVALVWWHRSWEISAMSFSTLSSWIYHRMIHPTMIFWWSRLLSSTMTSIMHCPVSRGRCWYLRRSIAIRTPFMFFCMTNSYWSGQHIAWISFGDTSVCLDMCSCFFWREWEPMMATPDWRNMPVLRFSSSLCKFTVSYILSDGVFIDSVDANLWASEATFLELIYRFCKEVVALFGPEFSRQPNVVDTTRLMAVGHGREFTLDRRMLWLQNWEWKTCLFSWKRQYKGCVGQCIVILKVVASHDL